MLPLKVGVGHELLFWTWNQTHAGLVQREAWGLSGVVRVWLKSKVWSLLALDFEQVPVRRTAHIPGLFFFGGGGLLQR